MYAGRVACCALVSHGDYAPRALLRLERDGRRDRQTDRQTDGRQTITLGAASVLTFGHAKQSSHKCLVVNTKETASF